jgi:DNA-binding ferritin-like protein (Dps family)
MLLDSCGNQDDYQDIQDKLYEVAHDAIQNDVNVFDGKPLSELSDDDLENFQDDMLNQVAETARAVAYRMVDQFKAELHLSLKDNGFISEAAK